MVLHAARRWPSGRTAFGMARRTGVAAVPAFDDDNWELYDTTTDWTQSKNLAKEHPDKLHALQRLWLIEAVKYNVLPLDDRFAERANPDLAGRPQLIKGNRQMLFRGMGRLTESSIVNTKNKSHALTAQLVVPPPAPKASLSRSAASSAAGASTPRAAS